MPNLFVVSTLALGLIAATPVPQQPASAGNLQSTLAKLDAASAKFKNAQADFNRDEFDHIDKSHTASTGSVYNIRNGAAVEAGIKINGQAARIATYKNGILHDYNPKLNCYNVVDSSQNKARTEAFLTLGFGGSGKDLAAKWKITDLGPETVEGVKTEKLELISNDLTVRNNFAKVTLWMDLDRDISIKQQFLIAGTDDINTATYTHIRLNDKVNTAPFDFKAKPCK